MKLLTAFLALMLATATIALAGGGKDPCRDSQDVREIFGCETDEFSFERFDDSTIMMAINRDARIACDASGLCQLSSVTSNDRRFTATFSVGQGSMYGSMGGSGTNIIIPSSGGSLGCAACSEPYYGITLRFTTGSCTQKVNVPRAVYYAINRYMYGLMTEEGGTRRGFTPADEAMIMFYTTVMKQATGCVAAQ
jgi:hypothetical protein